MLSKTLPLAAFLLAFGPVPAFAEDPVDIDKLIAEYVTARDVAASAVKTAAAKKSILAEAAAVLNKRLADLGVTGPVPPPPPPTDPLVVKFHAAYLAETGADKVEATKDLIELCKQVAAMAADPGLVTVGKLAEKASTTGKTLMKGRVPGVYAVFKTEVSTAFPTDGPLTPELRTAAADLFTKLQSALTEATK